MMNTVYIIVFFGAYTISDSLCNQDKELEYKSSYRISRKDLIKYCLFLKWNVFRTATKLGTAPL